MKKPKNSRVIKKIQVSSTYGKILSKNPLVTSTPREIAEAVLAGKPIKSYVESAIALAEIIVNQIPKHETRTRSNR